MGLLLRRHSLVARLLWFTLFAMTMVTLLIAGLVHYMVGNNGKHQAVSQQQVFNRAAAQRIETELQERISRLQRLADQLILTNELLPRADIQQALDSRLWLHDAFNNGLMVLGSDGRIHVDSPRLQNRVGIDLSDREHFIKPKTSLQPYISEPMIGRAIHEPVYVVSVPLLGQAGEFFGTLVGNTRLLSDNLLTKISASHLAPGGHIYVLDFKNDLIVTSSRADFVMVDLDIFADSRVVDRVRNGELSGVAGSHFGGEVTYSATALAGTGWVVLNTAPMEYWTGALRQLLVQISLLAFASLLLMGAGALVYLRYQLMPLKAAADGVKQMNRNLVELKPLPVYRDDEVGQFVGAFNGLLARLQSQTRDLKQSKDDAEEASRVKTKFLANISHELRTPLNAVIGLAGIQLARTKDNEGRERLLKVLQSSRLLLSALDAILTYVAVEGGQLSRQPEDFDIHVMLSELDELFRPVAEAKGLQFEVVAPELPDLIKGDRQHLLQVLVNLLGNAIKFTEAGHVQLEVTTLAENGDVLTLRFAVADTGIGIDESRQQELFGAFQQIEAGHTRTVGGVGMGLALSQKLALLMQSDGIRVESTAGQGSIFSFMLPVQGVNAGFEHASPLQETGDLAVTTGVLPADIQILVADDNPINREVVESQLQQLGIGCVCVENGREAVEQVARSRFDLILMDIQMPEMDGYEATRLIRESGSHVPIIALTAAVLTEDRDAALGAGMNAHLSKPFMPEELVRLMQSCLPDRLISPGVLASPHAESSVAASTKRYRLLIVDDEVVNLKVLATRLKDEYTVQVSSSGEKALQLARGDRPPDLILLDIIMPDMDGYAVCRALKNDPVTSGIPVIFVTALNDAVEEEKGLGLGAVDYITKPYQMPVVHARIRTHISLKAKTDQLEEMSYLDGLTHVPNRRHLDTTLARELKRLQRSGLPLGLVMLDIDFFKPFNDHYGHGRGDECLQQVASALQQTLSRSGDLLARYGGEEFLAVLPETDAAGVLGVAERMRSAVESLRLSHEYSEIADHITISLGCLSERVTPSMTVDGLLQRTDQALYAAKERGRNCVVMASAASASSVIVREAPQSEVAS